MKATQYINKVIIFLFVVFLSQDLFAGFEILKSGTTENLNSVYFVSDRVGFAVGDNGTIVKTRNGGKSWILLETHTHVGLKGVWFIDREKGFVVGDNNTLLATNDGGKSWDAIETPVMANYSSIQFVGVLKGYVSGQYDKGGVVLITEDGGSTWNAKIINVNCDDDNNPGYNCDKLFLQTVSFFDENDGLVGGYSYNAIKGKQPFICKTTDGGKNFNNISPEFEKNEWSKGYEIRALNYISPHDAFAMRNHGHNKSFLYAGDYALKGFENISSGIDHEYHSLYFSLVFLDRMTGYISSVINGQTQILKTIDAGESYMFLMPPTEETLYGSFFTSVNIGFFVGQNGTILRLTDHNNSNQSLFAEADENEEFPFSVATQKNNMSITNIFVYNVNVNDKRNIGVSFYNKYGKEIPVKNSHVKMFKKEFQIKVKTESLSYGTYFYTIKLKDKAVVNGKFSIGNYAQFD